MAGLMISKLLFLLTLTLLALNYNIAEGAISDKTQRKINKANGYGPFVGIVAVSKSQMDLLLQHPSFTNYNYIIEVSGKKFIFGGIGGEKVIVVMAGSSMTNAGITTQLLVTLFKLKGVVHYGIAGGAGTSLTVGDVTIPRSWSHSGRWTWQKFGSGPEDKPSLQGYLKFADYAVNASGFSDHDNLLSSIWYQQEEVFFSRERRRRIFWVPVDANYYNISRKLEGLELDNCINDTCEFPVPKVSRVRRGTSASIYLDNAAYADFLVKQFRVVPVDMEGAAVALICLQQGVPFINIKSIADLAGRSSSAHTETFGVPLAAKNAVKATVEFIKLLPQYDVSEPVFDM